MNQAKIDMIKAGIARNPIISLYLVFFCIFLDKAKKERRFHIFMADIHPRERCERRGSYDSLSIDRNYSMYLVTNKV